MHTALLQKSYRKVKILINKNLKRLTYGQLVLFCTYLSVDIPLLKLRL